MALDRPGSATWVAVMSFPAAGRTAQAVEVDLLLRAPATMGLGMAPSLVVMSFVHLARDRLVGSFHCHLEVAVHHLC